VWQQSEFALNNLAVFVAGHSAPTNQQIDNDEPESTLLYLIAMTRTRPEH
jgi:hypothetical protein